MVEFIRLLIYCYQFGNNLKIIFFLGQVGLHLVQKALSSRRFFTKGKDFDFWIGC